MLTNTEKSNLMHSLMKLGETKHLGFIELNPIVALILNSVIQNEVELQTIFNSMTKDLK